jgi:6-phosphogluconolactonase
MTTAWAPEVVVVEDASALAAAAADRIGAVLAGALAARRRASIALAGGTTPRAAYARLAARTDLDWSRIDFFWGDERAVAPHHAASNYRMARSELLDRIAVPAVRVHRMPADAADLDMAACEYEARLRTVLEAPPRMDLVLLGLGSDGHVASLFPHHAAVAARTRWVVATPAPAIAPRLTFTFAVIGAARHVLGLASGAAKRAALARALGPALDPMICPAQAVRALHVTWIVDRAARPEPA